MLVHVACLPESEYCRGLIQEALELIGNKWAVPLILTLYARSPLRNSDLRKSVRGISAKELAKQLRLLEAAGLIGRKVHPTVPPKVEYWLTALGTSLQPLLDGLAAWASVHGAAVEQNRGSFTGAPEAPGKPGAPAALIHRIR